MVYVTNIDETTKQYRNNQRYFRFVLKNQNEGAEGDDSGFIDPLKPQDYADANTERVEKEGSYEKYKSKARGNLRWINLCVYLSRYGVNYMQVNDIMSAEDPYETDGKEMGAISTPSEITFTMGFDNANYMYYKNSEGKEFTSNDPIDEDPYTIPTDKYPATRLLKAIIADFMINNYKGIMDVWDPTKDTYGKNPSDAPLGLKTPQLTANKLIDSLDNADGWITIYEIYSPEYPQDVDTLY